MNIPGLSTTARLAFGLAMLSVSLMLVGNTLGLLPNSDLIKNETRLQISELLALAITIEIADEDEESANSLISMFKDRNEDAQSVILRKITEATTEHHKDEFTQPTRSNSVVIVPINRGGERWGSLEIVFSEEDSFLEGVKSGSLLLTILFVAIAGFLTYWFFLKRALTELDPSAVVPDHINAVLDTMSEGIVMLDRSGRIVLTNLSFRNKTGRLSSELIGQYLSKLHWDCIDSNNSTLPWDALLNSGEQRLSSEIALHEPSFERICFNVHIASIQTPDGQVRGVVVTFDDVTEIHIKNDNLQRALEHLGNSQREIRRQNDELRILATRDPLTNTLNRRSFFEGFNAIVDDISMTEISISCIMIDLDNFKTINDEFGHNTGDKVIKMLANVLLEQAPDNALVGRYGGEEFCVALPGVHESDAAKIAESIRCQLYAESASAMGDDLRRITASLGVSCTTGSKLNIEKQVDLADQALYFAKKSGKNRVICYSQLEKAKRTAVLFDKPVEVEPAIARLASYETDYKTLSNAKPSPVKQDGIGNVVQIHTNPDIRDTTDSFLQEDLTHELNTLIPVALTSRITQSINRSNSLNIKLAILIIDFPTIGLIRNSAGDGTAKKLLGIGLERVNKVLNTPETHTGADTVKGFPPSRISATQYISLLTDIDDLDLIPLIVQRIFDSVDDPIHIEGREILLDTRIGISVFPLDAEDSITLVTAATAALQVALSSKERNTCTYFSNEMNEQSESILYMQSQLHKALERGELFMMYQPLINMKSGSVSSFEALIRWRHPQLGMVSPEQFIPIAEQTGLIDKIGDWVVLTACTQLKQWNDRGFSEVSMAVNVAAPQLRRNDFVSRIRSTVASTGIDPTTLTVELTESTLIENFEEAVSVVNDLANIGARIALDDFGTGYSSLSYLKSFPIDIVKIDRSFFTEFPDDVYSMSIVSAIISMVHSLGLKVVAEGVETSDQLAFLQSLNIDVVQGYYFSAPLTQQQVASLLENPEDIRRKFHAASTFSRSKSADHAAAIAGVLNEAPPWAA